MSVATLTSRGQITIPKEVRDSLNLKTSDKVAIFVANNTAILKPIKGDILDIGGSIKVKNKEKPVDFEKVRREVLGKIARNAAEE